MQNRFVDYLTRHSTAINLGRVIFLGLLIGLYGCSSSQIQPTSTQPGVNRPIESRVPPILDTQPATRSTSPIPLLNIQVTNTVVPISTTTPNVARVRFIYDNNLNETEFIEVIVTSMENVAGIKDVASSKDEIEISYDPDLLTIDDIQKELLAIGIAVHLPEE